MKDCYDRIHIFEVKSLNESSKIVGIDREKYSDKVRELKKCYEMASKLTKQYFYLPILRDDVWHITQYYNGEVKELSKEQFISFFNKKES